MKRGYLYEVVEQLRTQFGCKDNEEIPDGPYPMRIDGRTDIVLIKGDTISVNNLKPQRAILKND